MNLKHISKAQEFMLQSRWKVVDREYLNSIPHYLKKMCTVHHHIKNIKEDFLLCQTRAKQSYEQKAQAHLQMKLCL